MDGKIVAVASALPRCCLTCGLDVGPFVDTGYTSERHSFVDAVYVCLTCVAGLGAAAGYDTPEQAAEQAARIVELEQDVADLEAALEEARAARVVPIGDVFAALEARVGTPAAGGAGGVDIPGADEGLHPSDFPEAPHAA